MQDWLRRARTAARVAQLKTRIGQARKRQREKLAQRVPKVREKPLYVRGKRAARRGF